MLDDFASRFPECSKKSVERKMRELFERCKKEGDPRQRWYATEATLMELNLTEDEGLRLVAQERLQAVIEEVNRAKEEVMRVKEEVMRAKEEQRNQAK